MSSCHRCGRQGPYDLTFRFAAASKTGACPLPSVWMDRTAHTRCPRALMRRLAEQLAASQPEGIRAEGYADTTE